MRLISCVSVAFILLVTGAARAQDWHEYVSREDLFAVNFPAQPEVQPISYTTEYGLALPGRVHRVVSGASRYAVTVIDYTNAQALHAARVKGCKEADVNLCTNNWVADVRGAMDYAVRGYLLKNTTITDYAYYNSERVEGRRIQLLNPDASRTFVAINMHENRLYIIEGTVPANAPPPGLFQQSIGWVDAKGVRVRYESPYANMYPPPPRVRYEAASTAVPDLAGMKMGTTRQFTEGPFAGQTWGIDGSGLPYLVREGQPTNTQGLP